MLPDVPKITRRGINVIKLKQLKAKLSKEQCTENVPCSFFAKNYSEKLYKIKKTLDKQSKKCGVAP